MYPQYTRLTGKGQGGIIETVHRISNNLKTEGSVLRPRNGKGWEAR